MNAFCVGAQNKANLRKWRNIYTLNVCAYYLFPYIEAEQYFLETYCNQQFQCE
jgi:hypothetical protein